MRLTRRGFATGAVVSAAAVTAGGAGAALEQIFAPHTKDGTQPDSFWTETASPYAKYIGVFSNRPFDMEAAGRIVSSVTSHYPNVGRAEMFVRLLGTFIHTQGMGESGDTTFLSFAKAATIARRSEGEHLDKAERYLDIATRYMTEVVGILSEFEAGNDRNAALDFAIAKGYVAMSQIYHERYGEPLLTLTDAIQQAAAPLDQGIYTRRGLVTGFSADADTVRKIKLDIVFGSLCEFALEEGGTALNR